ncbi:T9SS C-terminal target domain-containing protein [Chitinophaga silvatica]|uniref:T9SS C-terminal target domain-containing protein n=1 Tax=Chitinophaga silvatica TaxID=2282649 RepID=A0A3E1YCH5_9BACT|nr:putative Ig domain-containing protein [Chitinophaga silvatica]RFS23955.1 T9SS C-terminal target domain-containing protein [Chitinophaga silvatica]
MSRFLQTAFFILLSNWCLGQNYTFNFNPTKSKSDSTLILGGTLDAVNTLTPTFNGFKRVFQPLKSIRITNQGVSTIISPRLIINNSKNWYNINRLIDEINAGVDESSTKDKYMAVWNFAIKNHFHFSPAETGDEQHDPIKLFAIYGYGICDDITRVLGTSSKRASNFTLYDLNVHVVPDLYIDSDTCIIDGDTGAFYLGLDNKKLVGYNSLIADRYLISRTHHYGSSSDNPDWMDKVVSTFYGSDDFSSLKSIPPFSTYHTLDYNLRPQESIIFDETISNPLYHSYQSGSVLKSELVSNGRFEYNIPFKNELFPIIFDSVWNCVAQNGSLKLTKNDGGFIVKVASPFVLVDGNVKYGLGGFTSSDYFKVSYSTDLLNWKLISNNSTAGTKTDNLTNTIATLTTPATYGYFLKFECHTSNTTNFKIDSLIVTSVFQNSKLFIPDLKLGNNLVHYEDDNTGQQQVQVTIAYQQTTNNRPPSNLINPIFPADKSTINYGQFQFAWSVPSDPDGDTITDYEIEVSERPDMKYPLSPNFKRMMTGVYTYNPPPIIPAAYYIPWPGLLNNNTTYYWHVRAKDSKGAWGDWSNTFQFIPHSPMPVLNPQLLRSPDSVKITWDKNPEGLAAIKYLVYASNEADGFTPSTSNLIATVDTTSYSYKVDDTKPAYAFYRVSALTGENNQKSTPTSLLKLSYPDVFAPIESVESERQVSIPLYQLSKYRINYNMRTDAIDTIKSNVVVTPVKLPSWLSYDPACNCLKGYLDSSTAHRLLYNERLSKVTLLASDKNFNEQQTLQFRVNGKYINHKPIVNVDTLIAFNNHSFNDSLEIIDIDLPYGDSVYVNVISKPSWIQKADFADSVFRISGVPTITKDMLDSVVIDVFDTYSRQRVVIPINIYLSPVASFAVSYDTLCRGNDVQISLNTRFKKPWSGRISGYNNQYDIQSNSPGYTLSITLDSSAVFTIDNLQSENYLFNDIGGTLRVYIRPNFAPEIVSTLGDTTIDTHSATNFQIQATDKDSIYCTDILKYNLINSPQWASVDELLGNIVLEPGPDDIGYHNIVYTVTDLQGHVAQDSFNLLVANVPVISSSPKGKQVINKEYVYDISVNDGVYDYESLPPDLTFNIIEKPDWLTYDSVTLLLRGTPRKSDVGKSTVILSVENQFGLNSLQSFTLLVTDTTFNKAVNNYDVTVFPNPIYNKAIVEYKLKSQSHITISLYDVQGKLIGIVLDKVQDKGGHYFNWSPSEKLPTGVYFLEFRFNNIYSNEVHKEVKRLMIL